MYYVFHNKMEKREEQKKKILKTLKKFGKLPSAKIASIAGINYNYLKPMLEELLIENKIVKIEETLATYWELAPKKRASDKTKKDLNGEKSPDGSNSIGGKLK